MKDYSNDTLFAEINRHRRAVRLMREARPAPVVPQSYNGNTPEAIAVGIQFGLPNDKK